MYIMLGIIIAIILIIAGMYNSLINKKNQVENAFGGMDALRVANIEFRI